MTEEEAEYRKWHTPDDWDRKVALLKRSFDGAKAREAHKQRMIAKRSWWRKRQEVTEMYGV